MMFLGPKAESPPKKTPSRLHIIVSGSTTGQSHLLNSMPISRSIQGNALSWPMASITSSQGMNSSPVTLPLSIRPLSSTRYFINSNIMPTTFPSSMTNSFGE